MPKKTIAEALQELHSKLETPPYGVSDEVWTKAILGDMQEIRDRRPEEESELGDLDPGLINPSFDEGRAPASEPDVDLSPAELMELLNKVHSDAETASYADGGVDYETAAQTSNDLLEALKRSAETYNEAPEGDDNLELKKRLFESLKRRFEEGDVDPNSFLDSNAERRRQLLEEAAAREQLNELDRRDAMRKSRTDEELFNPEALSALGRSPAQIEDEGLRDAMESLDERGDLRYRRLKKLFGKEAE